MRRMNGRKYSIIIVCVLYASLFSVALLNFVVDPFYIFRTPFLKVRPQINDRYDKIAFLEKNKKSFNSYIMGSSRMLSTHPVNIERYIPGAKFYNLGIVMGTAYEHYMHLNYFINKGYPVKCLYIGLDIDFCFLTIKYDERDSLFRLHPDVTNEGWWGYYWFYLSISPKSDLRRKLKWNFSRKKMPSQEYGKDGASKPEAEDKRIFEERREFGAGKIHNKAGNKNIMILRKMVALCRQHGIQLITFVNPPSRMAMDHYEEDDYLMFLKELADVAPFWDFSGYNSITTNPQNYIDHSHYKSSISRLMAARIFGDQTLPVPGDFGVWVTKENIETRLENLRTTIKKYRSEDKRLDLGAPTKAASQGLP